MSWALIIETPANNRMQPTRFALPTGRKNHGHVALARG
jgi:hypothetical protein